MFALRARESLLSGGILDELDPVEVAGIELVKDSATQERFTATECKQLLGEILSPRTFELGLICRTEDKAEPVIQLAPPLIAGPEEFEEIVRVLRQAITEAQENMG